MNRLMKRLSTISVLALSLFAWGCDAAGDMTTPQLEPTEMVVMSRSGKRYTVASESNPEVGSVSAEIGKAGGVLNLGKHTLWVSRNAVDAPTKFTMTRDPGNALRVKLTAGQKSENDIGAAGFDAPVYLSLSYQKAEDAPRDKSVITIVYFRPDGLVEELETQVTLIGKTAVAPLPHFSLFGIAWP